MASAARVEVIGPTFFDLVFTDLVGRPEPGTEVRSRRLGSSPGGAATVAVALARLGLEVGLTSLFATDVYGSYLVETLSGEGIDLGSSRQDPAWTTPVTVSVADQIERSMITYETEARWTIADLVPDLGAVQAVCLLMHPDDGLLASLRSTPALVFADVGWDSVADTESHAAARLHGIDVFLPNGAEAQGWTGCDDPADAVRRLAQAVPLAVVKAGAAGSLAARNRTLWREPSLAMDTVDPTGAGDVFDAGFVYGSLAGWPVEHRLRFANLCAGLSVRYPGGALSAPCWRDIAAWWATTAGDERTRTRYRFLAPVLDHMPATPVCRRSTPTIAAAPGPAPASAAASAPARQSVGQKAAGDKADPSVESKIPAESSVGGKSSVGAKRSEDVER